MRYLIEFLIDLDKLYNTPWNYSIHNNNLIVSYYFFFIRLAV